MKSENFAFAICRLAMVSFAFFVGAGLLPGSVLANTNITIVNGGPGTTTGGILVGGLSASRSRSRRVRLLVERGERRMAEQLSRHGLRVYYFDGISAAL